MGETPPPLKKERKKCGFYKNYKLAISRAARRPQMIRADIEEKWASEKKLSLTDTGVHLLR